MTNRTVQVILSATTAQFESAMTKAQASAKGLAGEMDKAKQAGDLKPVAGALTAYGAAVATVGGLVAKVGIEYNTLQQTSRAALTTLTGSAIEANAQMNKLDEFARTSPFAKDVFIRAQQQMLAFGIESQKVIPYLSAINDAVAAAGGNNHDVGELARIMSQISASAKITATDLREFGNRGVDAATIIGSAMGVTGAEIRDQITDGTLDAGAALDALAAGMSATFEGVSANVKNTMAGATDRVKAAFRDLAASLMEPAVGQDGGGWLVDMTNNVADLLRMLDRAPQATKSGVTAIAGVTAAVALLGAGIINVVPKVHATAAALRALPAAAGPAGLAIAGLTTVVGMAIGAWLENRNRVESYVSALKDATGESEAMIRSDILARASKQGLKESMDDINVGYITLVDAMRGNAAAQDLIIRKYDEEIERLQAVVDAGGLGAAAHGEASRAVQELTNEKSKYVTMLGEETAASAEAKAIVEEMALANRDGAAWMAAYADASSAMWERSTGSKEKAIEVTRELSDAEKEWQQTVVDAAGGFIDQFGALEAAQQSYAERAAENAGKSKDAWQEFAAAGKFALGDFAAELQKQIDAQEAWAANIIALHGKVSSESLNALIHMAQDNPQQAALLAQSMMDATVGELASFEPVLARSGQMLGFSLVDTMDSTVGDYDLSAVMSALGDKGGQALVDEAAGKLVRGEATLAGIVAAYDLEAQLEINTDPAERQARAALNRISQMSATVQVYAHHRNGFDAPAATGGRVGDVAAAYGLSSGGYVRGSGTGTSDTATTVRLSNGEFVIREWAAARIGAANLYEANRTGRLPSTYNPQRVLTSTANSSAQQPATQNVTYVTLEGREAMRWVMDNLRDGTRRAYQTEGVHG